MHTKWPFRPSFYDDRTSSMLTYVLEPANFADYRDFLRHRFESLKAANNSFSLQNCAQKSCVSKSLLQFLFNKKRHISLDKLPGLAKSLKLTNDEEYFVYLMVCKNSSQNPSIQRHFENILARVRHQYLATAIEAPDQSDEESKSLYQDYLFLILQTMARLEGFKDQPEWILENLAIKDLTLEKVRTTLQELEKLGYMFRDESGKLQVKPTVHWRPDPYDPKGHKVYHRIAKSIAELLLHPEVFKPSVYMGLSLSMDEENLAKAEKYMIEVHHYLTNLAKQSQHRTAVVYIGNFLLTVARLQAATSDRK